jgi:hypothetical protein
MVIVQGLFGGVRVQVVGYWVFGIGDWVLGIGYWEFCPVARSFSPPRSPRAIFLTPETRGRPDVVVMTREDAEDEEKYGKRAKRKGRNGGKINWNELGE